MSGEEHGGLADLVAQRRAKLERLRAAGIDPFPHAFPGVERSRRCSRRTRRSPPARRPTSPTASRAGSRRAASQGRAAFIDLVDRSGRIQLHARVDELGEEGFERLVEPRPRRPRRRRRRRDPHAARRALAARDRVHAAREVAAAAAGQAPRPDRRRDALPPARARPDRERGRRARSSRRARGSSRRSAVRSTTTASSRSRRRSCSRSTGARRPARS